MFRKLTVALGATAMLAAAALAPTAAVAKGGKHWHGHHGWHGNFRFSPVVIGSDCYMVKRVYYTSWGKKRVRFVEICD